MVAEGSVAELQQILLHHGNGNSVVHAKPNTAELRVREIERRDICPELDSVRAQPRRDPLFPTVPQWVRISIDGYMREGGRLDHLERFKRDLGLDAGKPS